MTSFLFIDESDKGVASGSVGMSSGTDTMDEVDEADNDVETTPIQTFDDDMASADDSDTMNEVDESADVNNMTTPTQTHQTVRDNGIDGSVGMASGGVAHMGVACVDSMTAYSGNMAPTADMEDGPDISATVSQVYERKEDKKFQIKLINVGDTSGKDSHHNPVIIEDDSQTASDSGNQILDHSQHPVIEHGSRGSCHNPVIIEDDSQTASDRIVIHPVIDDDSDTISNDVLLIDVGNLRGSSDHPVIIEDTSEPGR